VRAVIAAAQRRLRARVTAVTAVPSRATPASRVRGASAAAPRSPLHLGAGLARAHHLLDEMPLRSVVVHWEVHLGAGPWRKGGEEGEVWWGP